MPAKSRLLFGAAIFLASFLLFLSEPMAAKQLLPIFGGSAAVWMTCLVFFQVTLLAGYLYAHAITRGPPTQRQSTLHIALLTLAAAGAILWSTGTVHLHLSPANPVTAIFVALTLSIGLPFLMLASTSPLLQVWLARQEQNPVRFRLFALSNFASLLALLAYPTLIEPYLSLSHQRAIWAAGVLLFALITAAIAWQTRLSPSPTTDNEQRTTLSATLLRTKLLWFLLPMAAAMQLSAITAHLTSNIAAIPLLWIIPLAVYLLTFILAFQFPQVAAWRNNLMGLLAVMVAGVCFMLFHADRLFPISIAIFFCLVEAFLACLFLNSELYALRPARTSESTLFYLTIAAGGATGSFLVGIAAPLVFSGNYDLALTFLATALLAVAVVWDTGWRQRLLWAAGSAALVFLVFALHTAYHRQTLLATRNFYSSLRVRQSVTSEGDPIRTLLNGSIQHGTQIFTPALMRVPTTYYSPNSGAGLTLLNCCAGRTRSIGIIGLGSGTLAAYGKPGDTIRFYELNPAVLPIAQNLFVYLKQSTAHITFVEGDARASLTAEPPQNFDVLVIDAFSGDAVPLHLLTVEAIAVYRRHLAPGGILAFHVSNQYVYLEPEIAALAASAHLQARHISNPNDDRTGALEADWILVTGNTAFLDQPSIAVRAEAVRSIANVYAWTDNYSSLLPLVHWSTMQR